MRLFKSFSRSTSGVKVISQSLSRSVGTDSNRALPVTPSTPVVDNTNYLVDSNDNYLTDIDGNDLYI